MAIVETSGPLFSRTLGWYAQQPDDLQRLIERYGRIQRFADEAEIYRWRDKDATLYGVVEGRVELANYSEDGHRVMVLSLGPGHWFGVMGIFDGRPRPQTAVAKGETHVLALSPSAIKSITDLQPHYWRNFGQITCDMLRLAARFFSDLPPSNCLRRVAAYLALLDESELVENFQARPLRISQEDLASTLGITRQSVNRALSELAEAGLILRSYGVIRVLDAKRLRAYGDS